MTVKDKIPDEGSTPTELPETAQPPNDKVTIIIHKDPNDPTSLVVNGAVNGVNYSIKRGEKVQVSKAILESLENAKGKAYYQDEKNGLQESDISSYPLSVLSN